jgi:hypothetical protein
MAHVGIRYINGSDFIAKGIDWVTHSLLDHAEFWFDAESMAVVLVILSKHGMSTEGLSPEGGYLGAHAGSGIQFRPLDYCVPTWERRYKLSCTDENFEALVVSAFGKIGTGYNYLGIGGILLRMRKMTSDIREFCSEFCFDETFKVGIFMLNAREHYKNLITPESLHLSPLHMPAFGGHCTYSFPVAQ